MAGSRQIVRKTYKRYCGGAISSGLLALCLVGVFVVILFLPIFVFAGDGVTTTNVSGLDLIYFAFRDSITKVPYEQNPKLQYFALGMDTYGPLGGQNGFFVFLSQYHVYFEIALVAIFGIGAVFAVVVSIFGLVFICAGRNHNTVMVSALSSSALFSSISFFGLSFLYFFLAHKMFIEMGSNAAVKIHYYSFIVLGCLIAITIALSIIYHVSFKGKRFAGAVAAEMKAQENDFVPRSVNNNAPYMNQNGQVSKPQNGYDPNRNDLPPNISEIGENAFAMNIDIKHILIPEGIYFLGPGAFSNCLYLETVVIPHSVQEIGYNCFFNTPNLKEIYFLGTMDEFERIVKGSNWLTLSGANIVTTQDGRLLIEHQ